MGLTSYLEGDEDFSPIPTEQLAELRKAEQHHRVGIYNKSILMATLLPSDMCRLSQMFVWFGCGIPCLYISESQAGSGSKSQWGSNPIESIKGKYYKYHICDAQKTCACSFICLPSLQHRYRNMLRIPCT